MARGVQIDVLGLGGFVGDLNTLRTSVRTRLEDALAKSAEAVKFGAIVRVPRDQGDLANAIAVGGKGVNRSVGIDDKSVPQRGGRNSAHLNPWVYGLWVEIGLRNRRMAPRPFMGPAADAEEPKHLQRVEDALNEAIG